MTDRRPVALVSGALTEVSDFDDLPIGVLPTGTSGTTVALGNHTHAAYQPADSDLTAIAAISPTNDDVIQRKSGVWVARSMSQLKTDLALTASDVGLGSVTNDAQVAKSLVDAKGDLLVGTANDTVARKAVGGNGDPLVGDSSSSDGLRWDASRAAGGASWFRDVWGYKLLNTPDRGQGTAALGASVRTIQWFLGKGVSGDTLSTFYTYVTTAMTGGVATAALYESSSLTSNSWSRIGSNFTVNLTPAGVCTGSLSGSLSGDNYVRVMLVITTAPSVYPTFNCCTLLKPTLAGGHDAFSFKNASAAPGATLDPSTGWTQLTILPWAAVS